MKDSCTEYNLEMDPPCVEPRREVEADEDLKKEDEETEENEVEEPNSSPRRVTGPHKVVSVSGKPLGMKYADW